MGCEIDIEKGAIICSGSSGFVPEDEVKCNYIACWRGMGLAGSGHCDGEPRNTNCPKFEDEEEMLKAWKAEGE